MIYDIYMIMIFKLVCLLKPRRPESPLATHRRP